MWSRTRVPRHHRAAARGVSPLAEPRTARPSRTATRSPRRTRTPGRRRRTPIWTETPSPASRLVASDGRRDGRRADERQRARLRPPRRRVRLLAHRGRRRRGDGARAPPFGGLRARERARRRARPRRRQPSGRRARALAFGARAIQVRAAPTEKERARRRACGGGSRTAPPASRASTGRRRAGRRALAARARTDVGIKHKISPVGSRCGGGEMRTFASPSATRAAQPERSGAHCSARSAPEGSKNKHAKSRRCHKVDAKEPRCAATDRQGKQKLERRRCKPRSTGWTKNSRPPGAGPRARARRG